MACRAGTPRDLLAGHAARRQSRLRRPPDRHRRRDRSRVHARQQGRGVRRDHQSQSGRVRLHRRAAVHRRTSAGGEPRAITTRRGTAGRCRTSRPTAPRCSRCSKSRASNVYNPARLAAFSWPDPGKYRIVTDGIDRAVSTYAVTPDSHTDVLHGRGRRQRKAVLGAAGWRHGADACSASTRVRITNVVIPRARRQPLVVRQLGERQRARRGGADQSA